MRVLVVEDEGAARRRVESIIGENSSLQLVGSASSGARAIELINSVRADLLLMDIQLKDMTAFEVLNNVERNYAGNIIFITAYNNFAIKAFEVFALDYVLKPFTKERLLQAINRCRNAGKSIKSEAYAVLESLHFPDKVCIPEGRTSHLFEMDEIEWVKADGYHCEVHTIEGKVHLIRILLKDIDRLLPNHFLRISRSILVNKTHVVSFKKDKNETSFLLKNGREFFGKTRYL